MRAPIESVLRTAATPAQAKVARQALPAPSEDR